MVYMLAALIKRHGARLVLPALLVTLWLLPARVWSPVGEDPFAAARQANLIRDAIARSIHPGDDVFLSTADKDVRRAVEAAGAAVHAFDPTAPQDFQIQLAGLLDNHCDRAGGQDIYLVWTDSPGRGAFELGPAVREFNFFFRFQAQLPYKGYNVYAVDKFLRLEPKAEMIARYCEAVDIAAGRDVVAILDPRAFTPWIGSVTTANVTWLAADPKRTTRLSDFAVDGLPPVSTYDAYWMGFQLMDFTWSYKNSDAEAYREVFSRPGVNDALLLIDKKTIIGLVARGFVRECDEDVAVGRYFRRVCIK
ncbi:MAG: hypothetical protein GYA15_16265 [Leptolinea sp.]|jgi:hypothetical protein|nr:hypothetical protein [Leptolinea sp.]